MPTMPEQCTAALRDVLAFYQQHGCPCAFPRFAQLTQFKFQDYGTGPVGCHATEIAITLFTDPKTGPYQFNRNEKGEIINITCKVCGSEIDFLYEQYNINLAVSSLLFRIVHPRPLGLSPMGPIPMPPGYFGFKNPDIQKCAHAFSKEGSFTDMANYLKELPQP